jgi:hypothetical protein
MTKPKNVVLQLVAMSALSAIGCNSYAYTFEFEGGTGNFDSTISIGTGIRANGPSCGLVTQGANGSGAPTGCLSPTSALGDQGDLNYRAGSAFTTYLKGSHELLLKLPDEDVTFFGRVNWVKDFSATQTSGITSATTPATVSNGQASDANESLDFNARVLDLWVSKGFQLAGQQARVRVGNQVISWGESLFLPGGISSTNAMDIMRLSQPGTQLKEAVLPAPMASIASSLGNGFNAEAYVQTGWNADYMAPTGSYWSVVNGLGKGHDAYGLIESKARDDGQWGASLRYQPEGTQVNLGMYAMNYHDKAPQFSTNVKGSGAVGWVYAEDRLLYGLSANFPVGDWAIGTELSYRPKDAVSLNSAVSGCASQNGNCYVDEEKYQWHLTALLSLTPSVGGGLLKLLGADTATLLAESVVIKYPNLKNYYGGDPISAGGWGWGQETNPSGTSVPVGDSTSWGYNFDFSWVYDGTLIQGWQVVPEIYYFEAVSGRTPNASALFMQGAKSINYTVSFLQNPTKWQAAFNYAHFWGGTSVFDQPYADRDFFGITISRNF